jgi:hypothetical protein
MSLVASVAFSSLSLLCPASNLLAGQSSLLVAFVSIINCPNVGHGRLLSSRGFTVQPTTTVILNINLRREPAARHVEITNLDDVQKWSVLCTRDAQRKEKSCGCNVRGTARGRNEAAICDIGRACGRDAEAREHDRRTRMR